MGADAAVAAGRVDGASTVQAVDDKPPADNKPPADTPAVVAACATGSSSGEASLPKEGCLSVDDFCALMGGRGESREQLKARFEACDVDGSGTVDRRELVRACLIDALVLQRKRVLDLLVEWDTDGNNVISRKEFRRAVRALRQAPRQRTASV